jgi:hypothetical protein
MTLPEKASMNPLFPENKQGFGKIRELGVNLTSIRFYCEARL